MKIFLILLSYSIHASATANFHCYSIPNMPVQTYEYGSSNCDSRTKGPARGKTKIGEDGEKDIVCMYQAQCKPVAEDEAKKEPAHKPISELQNMVMIRQLKPSVLLCKGAGKVLNGEIVSANCPTPTQCHKDVFFNFISRSFSSGEPEPATFRENSK
jgi:hypothetical protein